MLKVCLVCAWRQLAVWRGSPPPLPADSWWQTVGGLYLADTGSLAHSWVVVTPPGVMSSPATSAA
jgi:hypothetical protein